MRISDRDKKRAQGPPRSGKGERGARAAPPGDGRRPPRRGKRLGMQHISYISADQNLTHGKPVRNRGEAAACLQQREGIGKEPQKMGRTGRKRDVEQRSGTYAEEMEDRPGPKNTSPEEKSRDPMLQDVLWAITVSRVALEGKIDALATDLTVLRDNHRRLAEKIATTDRQLKELLPEVKDITTKTQQMEKQIRDLELRAEDAENRSRRNSLRMADNFFTTYSDPSHEIHLALHDMKEKGPEGEM
ncbi:hypothetical protein NDU88_003549 [Pleurodeles waltl]|uniref:Uncharacterized protein n=1 Tax=Pleurodeles waltl TaxID=8319 RepID=A0AAV7WPE0_PLEWA|nr:hypothetical protein NDU88_003549 [Pleurodeles waltl]